MDKKEQAEVYNIYLRKAAEIYGVTRTRQIYEKAIEILSEAESRPMCLRFAEMETKLGEVDIIIIITIIIIIKLSGGQGPRYLHPRQPDV